MRRWWVSSWPRGSASSPSPDAAGSDLYDRPFDPRRGRAHRPAPAERRRYPGSRRHPQFNREVLASDLEAAGIGYRHAPELGGRRAGEADSPNAAWRNPSFRAYADHLATPGFRAVLDRIVDDAERYTITLMCAESVPWRCHRNLISDALVALGVEVRHILSASSVVPHEMHPAARVDERGVVTYPATPPAQGDLFE